jgi:hypothetical protein
MTAAGMAGDSALSIGLDIRNILLLDSLANNLYVSEESC